MNTILYYFAVRKVDELQDGQDLCSYVAVDDSTVSQDEMLSAGRYFWTLVQNQCSFDGLNIYSLPATESSNSILTVYSTCIVDVVDDYLCVAICNTLFDARLVLVNSILRKVRNHVELHSRNSFGLDTIDNRLRVWCALDFENHVKADDGVHYFNRLEDVDVLKGPPQDERDHLLEAETVGRQLDARERKQRARRSPRCCCCCCC